ncbi:unnamed protein product [Diatraea saccharalis]|uniref:BESS domain-containing protein n=1 Tax=Diatraea saccharalis TaxID=40085 RepID=A0A9N9RA70_9NEOP|nr:unnamed protein product [Diatraea saccharalis]
MDEIDSRLLQIEEEKLRCFQENTNDPDAQLLMSLLPFLKDIPKHRTLLVRVKLQQVLIDKKAAISSAVQFDNSDSSQYNVDFSVPQNHSIELQQSISILPQQLSDAIQKLPREVTREFADCESVDCRGGEVRGAGAGVITRLL